VALPKRFELLIPRFVVKLPKILIRQAILRSTP